MPDRLPLVPLLLAFVLVLATAFALNEIRAENASYNAEDLTLPDGTPARLVLPGARPEGWGARLPEGMPRPPLVILTHGVIANKELMSGLAHALARHGAAVLTIDWVGHAGNPNAFRRPALREQLEYAIDFMRERYGYLVDTERIALMGHSMGGGATLEYAAYNADIDMAVAIAAGWLTPGPVPPRNVLFVYGENDLPGVLESVPAAMRTLTGVPAPDHDVTYGAFEDGTARRMVVVPGTNHISVVSNAETAREIVHWLGGVWPLGKDKEFGDPRLRWLGVALVGTLGLSIVVARLLRPWLPVLDAQPFDRWPLSLAVLVVAFFVAILGLGLGNPFSFVGAWGGDYLAGFFTVAGLLLLGYGAATGAAEWKLFWPDWRATVVGAAVLALVAYVLFGGASTGAWVRLTLAPHRVPLALWMVGPTVLFCASQDALTKKGRLRDAALMSAGAAVALAVVFMVAGKQQLTPMAVTLVLPVMLPLIVIFELPSLAIYHYTRNYFLSGLYRGLLLSVFGAASWPLYG